MEAVGRLAGGVAHDFNNLLTAMLGHLHFLLEDLGETDPRRQDAEEVRFAAVRAQELTHQLLAFSRKQILEPQVLDPNAVVRALHGLMNRLLGEDVRLTLELDDRVGNVLVDRSQLEQVLINLAVNARDAMPNGGPLRISTRRELLTTMGPRGLMPGRYARLEIEDGGVGMPREVLDRIFEPFFTTKRQGTGLGLASVYGVVQQSGGGIDVRSEVGVGTTFVVWLPATSESCPAPVAPPVSVPAARSGERILIVEDDGRLAALAAVRCARRGTKYSRPDRVRKR